MASTLVITPQSHSFSLSATSSSVKEEKGSKTAVQEAGSGSSPFWNSLSAIRANTQSVSPTSPTSSVSPTFHIGKDDRKESPNSSVLPRGSCLLKKVDPSLIVEQYFSPTPSDLRIPKTKYQLVGTVAELKAKIPTDSTADIYQENDISGAHLACSSNRNAFVAFVRSNPERDCGNCCIWCRRNCSWTMMGIPTDLKPLSLSSTFGPQVDKRYEVPTELVTCSFECTLAQYDHMVSVNAVDSDPLFFNSRAIILCLFKLMYPGEELKAAPHYTLLQDNGGSLSAKEFFKGEHKWIRTGNLTPIPRQVVYIDGSSTYYS